MDKGLIKTYDQILQDQGRVKEMQFGDGALHPTPCCDKAEQQHNQVRIAYGTSAKMKKGNTSLNECMYRGPRRSIHLTTSILNKQNCRCCRS